MRRILAPAVALAALTLAGCTAPADNGLQVTDGWVRAMPSESADRTAAYFTIRNTTDTERRLIDVSVEGATAELHTTSVDDDVARMRQIEYLAVPPDASAQLAPGGDHVMLLGLQQRLSHGDTLHVALRFDDGQEFSFALPVVGSR